MGRSILVLTLVAIGYGAVALEPRPGPEAIASVGPDSTAAERALSSAPTPADSAELHERIRRLVATIETSRGHGQDTRYPSVAALIEIGEPAVPYLIEVLLERGPDTRAVPGLRARIKSRVARRRASAVRALGAIGPNAAAAVPALVALYESGHQRTEVVRAIGDIGPAAREAFSLLASALVMDVENGASHSEAIRALAKLEDPRTTSLLVDVYTASPNNWVRVELIKALAEIGDARAVPTLVRALGDDYEIVSRYAGTGLSRILRGEESARTTTLTIDTAKGCDEKVRQRVADLLDELGLRDDRTASFDNHDPSRRLREEWRHLFPDYASDFARFDPAGNLITARYVVTKFDRRGSPLWTSRLGDIDRATALELDSGGNTYVGGEREGRYVVVKLTPDGSRAWTASCAQITTKTGMTGALAVAADGTVYAAGTLFVEHYADRRVLFLRIEPDGRIGSLLEGVEQREPGRFGVADYSLDANPLMALDDQGNLYTLFSSFSRTPGLVLARFNALGQLDWIAPVTGFGAGGKNHLVIAPNGSIVLAGRSEDEGGRILCFDRSGEILWSRTLPSDPIQAVLADRDGRILAAWNRWPRRDLAVLGAFGNDGRLLWKREIAFPADVPGTGYVSGLDRGPDGSLAVLVSWEEIVQTESHRSVAIRSLVAVFRE